MPHVFGRVGLGNPWSLRRQGPPCKLLSQFPMHQPPFVLLPCYTIHPQLAWPDQGVLCLGAVCSCVFYICAAASGLETKIPSLTHPIHAWGVGGRESMQSSNAYCTTSSALAQIFHRRFMRNNSSLTLIQQCLMHSRASVDNG